MIQRILIILFVITCTSLQGQNVRRLEKSGDQAYQDQNYASAIHYYTLAAGTKATPQIGWKLAESARMNRNYKLAERWYKFVADTKSDKYPLAWFYLASVQKSMGLYQKASIHYKNSYFLLKNQGTYAEKKSRHEITACEKALFLTFEPVTEEYRLADSVFQSDYSEFQMLQLNDSTRWMTVLRPEDSPDTVKLLSRAVQYTKKTSSLQWTKTGFFNASINVPDAHVSSLAIDTALKIVVLSVCSPKEGRLQCNLWKMPLTDDTLVRPESMGMNINAGMYSSTHPQFADMKGKKYLLFSSDRPGGEGNYDIWISPVTAQGEFATPYNPGKVINTMDDEVTPFYDPNEKYLYFSSEYYNSLGGLDIFKIQTDFERWGFVENLGYPVNSSYHDLFFSHSLNHDFAFYSSNRPLDPSNPSPGCCNNVYFRELPRMNDSVVYEQRIAVITKKTRQLIPLNLFFHNDEPNPRTWDTSTVLSYEECFNSYTALTSEYVTEWTKPLTGEQAVVAGQQIEGFFIDSVENNFNKFKLFAEYMCELLAKGKNIEITIKGYASPLNTSDYNANLSKRRIQSLVNFLMQYKDGYLIPYIEGTAEAGNRLVIHRQAFGKEKAAAGVSGDIKDLRNSVYSPAAANERKVAIIAVEL